MQGVVEKIDDEKTRSNKSGCIIYNTIVYYKSERRHIFHADPEKNICVNLCILIQ